jgi:hypothetical protein
MIFAINDNYYNKSVDCLIRLLNNMVSVLNYKVLKDSESMSINGICSEFYLRPFSYNSMTYMLLLDHNNVINKFLNIYCRYSCDASRCNRFIENFAEGSMFYSANYVKSEVSVQDYNIINNHYNKRIKCIVEFVYNNVKKTEYSYNSSMVKLNYSKSLAYESRKFSIYFVILNDDTLKLVIKMDDKCYCFADLIKIFCIYNCNFNYIDCRC